MEKFLNQSGAVLAVYFIGVLTLGWFARRSARTDGEGFFLAGRSLSPWALAGTMIATNLSAFTVFGASGAGYRDGLSFFPIMAFGTGFMALNFRLIGHRIWEIGREHGLVTPAELVGKIYGNRQLAVLFALVLVAFTVPYLALQPMAAGKVLGELFNIPDWGGAVFITLVIVAYTLRGGLKAVAWTDLFQGVLMIGLLIVSVVIVTGHYGGWGAAFGRLFEVKPELFSRPGPQGTYAPGVWFGFLLLWFCCDPMFPQLFQRMFAAREKRALDLTMLAYPAVCTLIFGITISLGMLGRLEHPGLEGKAADGILPKLLTSIGGELLGTLVLAAGLAALMSTMDSQLLTLSSIFSKDLLPGHWKRHGAAKWLPRLFVVALALAGLILAVFTNATILEMGLTAFTGLAALFPTVLLGLYLKKPHAVAGLVSIGVGETLALAFHLKWLSSPGTIPAVWVIAASLVVFLAVQALLVGIRLPVIDRRSLAFGAGFLLIFIAAMDFLRWGSVGTLIWGWPAWAWYFILLSGVQTGLVVWLIRRDSTHPEGHQGA